MAWFYYTTIMANTAVISSVRQKYHALAPFLHEKARRRWAACEALALGRGGISVVAAATALSHPTIRRGIDELRAGDDSPLGEGQPAPPRIRRPGGGRSSTAAPARGPPTPGTANPRGSRLALTEGAVVAGPEFVDAAADGRMRECGGSGDHRNATAPQGEGLTSG